MKIFVARAEARILPLANRASVTPTTDTVARVAWKTMPGKMNSKKAEMPPTNRPSKAAYAMIRGTEGLFLKMLTIARTNPPSAPISKGAIEGFGFCASTPAAVQHALTTARQIGIEGKRLPLRVLHGGRQSYKQYNL